MFSHERPPKDTLLEINIGKTRKIPSETFFRIERGGLETFYVRGSFQKALGSRRDSFIFILISRLKVDEGTVSQLLFHIDKYLHCFARRMQFRVSRKVIKIDNPEKTHMPPNWWGLIQLLSGLDQIRACECQLRFYCFS